MNNPVGGRECMGRAKQSSAVLSDGRGWMK